MQPTATLKSFKNISTALIFIYILLALLKNIGNIQFISETWAANVVLILGVISIYHGILWYGKKGTLVFFGITFIISWCLESLSIQTGFPFGNYYYTDLLLWKLGEVPVLIMPAYFSVGYLSWVMSHVLCNRQNSEYTKYDIVLIPCIAAFIMVLWDFTFDPLSSTVTDLWRWKGGGAYFGVPIQNFVGWYCCVFIIYVIFYVYIQKKPKDKLKTSSTKTFWLYPTLAYLFFSIDTLTRPIRALKGYDKNLPLPKEFIGKLPWTTYDIYYALALISVFTMIFIGLLTVITIFRVTKT